MIAQHLGLAAGTVSKVLNNASGAEAISEPTKNRILTAAREFQYRPNFLAQALRKGRTNMVGLLLQNLECPDEALLLGSIEQFLHQRGFVCIVGSHKNCKAALDNYADRFLRCGVDGMITVDAEFPHGSALPTVAITISGANLPSEAAPGPHEFLKQVGRSAAETLLSQIDAVQGIETTSEKDVTSRFPTNSTPGNSSVAELRQEAPSVAAASTDL
jgi:hypothetical protein